MQRGQPLLPLTAMTTPPEAGLYPRTVSQNKLFLLSLALVGLFGHSLRDVTNTIVLLSLGETSSERPLRGVLQLFPTQSPTLLWDFWISPPVTVHCAEI